MLDYECSVVLQSKVIICKFLPSWRQIFGKLRRMKFVTIALSLKDIELGLQSPMESFPSINLQSVAGSEYPCLSQKTAQM